LECEGEGEQWGAVRMDFPGEGEPPVDPPEEPPEPPPDPPGGGGDPPDLTSDADAVVCTAADVRTTTDLDGGSPTWGSEL
jgi:hypothetical protein